MIGPKGSLDTSYYLFSSQSAFLSLLNQRDVAALIDVFIGVFMSLCLAVVYLASPSIVFDSHSTRHHPYLMRENESIARKEDAGAPTACSVPAITTTTTTTAVRTMKNPRLFLDYSTIDYI